MVSETVNRRPDPASSRVFASWNLRGGLSDPERAHGIADAIAETQADVIVLPDAWREDSSLSVPSGRRLVVSRDDLSKNGYVMLDESLRESRPDDNYAHYHFSLLVKETVPHNSEVLQLDTRPVIRLGLHVGSAALNFVGLHLNDQGNDNRHRQMSAFRPFLDDMRGEPTMLGGDFNDMHAEMRLSRLLQARFVQKAFGKLTLGNSTVPRLIEMAEGASLQALEADEFVDADPSHAPTAPSRMPLFQFDRFMYRDMYVGGLTVGDVEHTSLPKLSDHLMIATTVRTQ